MNIQREVPKRRPINHKWLSRGPSLAEIELSKRYERFSKESPNSKFAFWCHKIVEILGNNHSPKSTQDVADIFQQSIDSFISRINYREMPSHLRFPSTMSPEAQAVFLKGYEDIIQCELDHFNAEMEVHRKQNLSPSGGKKRKVGSTHHLSPSSAYLQFGCNSVLNCSGRSSSLYGVTIRSMGSEFDFESSSNRDKTSSDFEEHCLLHSYRLENAMEIVDYIRECRGELVFSRRHKRHDIEPVEHFKAWSKEWRQEFIFGEDILN